MSHSYLRNNPILDYQTPGGRDPNQTGFLLPVFLLDQVGLKKG